MMRHSRVVLGIMLCVSLVGLSSCRSDSTGAGPTPTVTGSPVGNGVGATAVAGGFRVTVPAASVSGTGRLSAAETTAVPAAAAGVNRVGPGIHVDLDGAGLTGPATVSFTLPSGWSKNLIPIVVWQDGKGGWRWLPTAWKPGQTTATAQTDHFSDGFLGGVDIGAQARQAVKGFGAWMTGRSDVAQPRCSGQDAVRAKVRITSSGGDSIKWCLGVEAGKTVLKIANNRITYTEISYPDTWKVTAGQRFGVSLDALGAFAATKIAKSVGKPGREVILVKGGKTVELSLPAGSESKVIAQLSFYAWSLQALELALDIETKIAKLAGIELKNNGLDRLIGIVSNPAKLDAWGEAAQECLQTFTEEFTDDLTEPVELNDTAKKVFVFAGKCAGALGSVSASESGPLNFIISSVISAVSAVVGAVMSAVQLLVSITREIWDSLASFGGKSNPVYVIRLTPATPPTTVTNVDPITSSGAPKSGYTIQQEDYLLDCMPYVYASPSAVSGNIYSCGGTATNADVCWIEPAADHAYCGVTPWERKLRRFVLNQSPVPAVKAMAEPQPWGLVLADGSRCLRRIGGAWSGRPDDWTGAYWCEGTSTVVLAEPTKGLVVDKSRPTWIVRVGELDDAATSLPAPRPVAVRTAYFAAHG